MIYDRLLGQYVEHEHPLKRHGHTYHEIEGLQKLLEDKNQQIKKVSDKLEDLIRSYESEIVIDPKDARPNWLLSFNGKTGQAEFAPFESYITDEIISEKGVWSSKKINSELNKIKQIDIESISPTIKMLAIEAVDESGLKDLLEIEISKVKRTIDDKSEFEDLEKSIKNVEKQISIIDSKNQIYTEKLEKDLKEKADINHVHSDYVTKEDLVNLPKPPKQKELTFKDINNILLKENIDISQLEWELAPLNHGHKISNIKGLEERLNELANSGSTVDSVNSKTGVVVLTTDDIDEGDTNKYYPSADASKLATIAEGAEVNVNADWNASSGDAQILNKPTLFSGSYSDLTDKPTIPTKVSDLSNDSGFITGSDLPVLSKSISVESPTDSEDISMFFTPIAITVTKMVAVLVGSDTPSVTWTIRHSTDRNATGNEVVTSGTTTTSTTTGSVVTNFNDATIPANSFVWLESTAQSGTVSSINVNIIYTED